MFRLYEVRRLKLHQNRSIEQDQNSTLEAERTPIFPNATTMQEPKNSPQLKTTQQRLRNPPIERDERPASPKSATANPKTTQEFHPRGKGRKDQGLTQASIPNQNRKQKKSQIYPNPSCECKRNDCSARAMPNTRTICPDTQIARKRSESPLCPVMVMQPRKRNEQDTV